MSVPIDVYCGVYKLSSWPFSDPLVVELEVERGSFFIADVHISANLPGLQRLLRRRLCGLPISEFWFLKSPSPQGTYHAEYWEAVYAGLFFAMRTFEKEQTEEYLRSFSYARHIRDGITPLMDSKRARVGRR